MSQSMIQAFTKGQYKAINAKDNKERLKFTVAGCRGGHLFAHDGTDYGLFNADAPDTEFITLKDLELSRITGAKIAQITQKMEAFFDKYGANPTEQPEAKAELETETTSEDAANDEPEIDTEAVVKACKKAIKKGNTKKALKLLNKLPEDSKEFKKLSKKLEA